MAISKKIRQQVYGKYSGKCAYTGKPLDDKWQVDHVLPVSHSSPTFLMINKLQSHNDLCNLLPALRIINHYKRGENLESFRRSIATLHLRLKKLPKKTVVERTVQRKKYLLEVAKHFEVTVDKPFDGIFYFEKVNSDICQPTPNL